MAEGHAGLASVLERFDRSGEDLLPAIVANALCDDRGSGIALFLGTYPERKLLHATTPRQLIDVADSDVWWGSVPVPMDAEEVAEQPSAASAAAAPAAPSAAILTSGGRAAAQPQQQHTAAVALVLAAVAASASRCR